MPRVTHRVASHKRKKKFLKLAKGARGGRSKLYRTAREGVEKGLAYAYRDRKQKKRVFRSLWVIRIGAKARAFGISYNQFIKGLKDANIDLNRKILAELAVNDEEAFKRLVEVVSNKKS